MEACKAFHYPGFTAWMAESPQVRAKLMAHELHKGMRDAYMFEMRKASGVTGETAPKTVAPWDQIRNRFFNANAKTT